MSPLTKLFVVMLIILSLLQTAAVVVFVNTTDDFQARAQTAEQKLLSAQTAEQTARQELASEQAASLRLREQVAAQTEQAKQTENTIRGQLIDLETRLAQAQLKESIQTATQTDLAGALEAAQNTLSRLNNMLTELRQTNDRLVAQNAQLNQSVTDLTNRLEVTERDLRFVSEQLTEARGQAERQGTMLKELGVPPEKYAMAGTGAGAPPINGVIRQVHPIYGVPYATISVGSADGVKPGMEFKVINRGGNFLGTLTVDTVELNEATGKLAGPQVANIQPGAEVKTQL